MYEPLLEDGDLVARTEGDANRICGQLVRSSDQEISTCGCLDRNNFSFSLLAEHHPFVESHQSKYHTMCSAKGLP